MANYYSHLESGPGGRDAALRKYAESAIREIDRQISDLQLRRRAYERVLDLTCSVCAVCAGSGRVTWYPPGTGPGDGERRLVRCPECDSDGYKLDIKSR